MPLQDSSRYIFEEILKANKESKNPIPNGPDDLVFPSHRGKKINKDAKEYMDIRAPINRAVKKLGLTVNITPHMFRHSFAHLLRSTGVELDVLQELLGHQDIRTTKMYLSANTKLHQAALSAFDNVQEHAQEIEDMQKEKVLQEKEKNV